jgi:transcription initiation factor IIF auxiliary subunit
MKIQNTILVYLIVMICGINMPTTSAQEISASNISQYVGNGKWNWTIFILAPSEVIRDIDCVEYSLPSTFPNPIRKVCRVGDLHYPFGLTNNGWGVFEVSIKVIFKNNTTSQLTHMLTFEAPPVEKPLPISADNIATQIKEGWWNWMIFIKGSQKDIDQIQCVEYTLHPTFPNPV